MSKILYAWELGAGYGHIARFLTIAQQLKQRGHQIIFALKNLEHADILLGKNQFHYLQSPIRWPTSNTMPAAYSYPGLLKNAGFDNLSGLIGRVHAWQSLYRYTKPDLILFDHAPTALLAARPLDIPKALFGAGFFAPPVVTPMPCIRPWLKISEKELLRMELEVLDATNSALQMLDYDPLTRLADLFDVNENFLCTFEELDHYQNRKKDSYWGPSLYQSGGIKPQWPSIGGNKIFAYLNLSHLGLETLLQQLKNSAYSVLVHIAGITPAFIQKHSGANLHISPHPYQLSEVCEQCDMAICHGGIATISSFLLSGKPLLILPFHLEQWLCALNLESLGAGKHITTETKKPNYRSTISEILTNPK